MLLRMLLRSLGTALVLTQLAGCGGGSADTPAAPTAPVLVNGLMALPGEGDTPQAVRLFPAAGETSRWCVFRDWPAERLHVYEACNTAEPRRVPFERGTQGELLHFATVDAGDALLLLTYDAGRNVPSGRLPGVLSEGVDIWKLQGGASTLATLEATRLPLGGFDNLIHLRPHAAGLTVCAVRRCFSVAHGSTVREWNTAALAGFEFVEVDVQADTAIALVRTADVPATGSVDTAHFHYALARLTPEGAELQRIDDTCLPFALQTGTTSPTWRCVATRADVLALLRWDIARMPHGGLMDFGSSNNEGRIAWSQTYYLAGMMQLADGKLPTLAVLADWGPLRERLRDELRLLARRASADGRGFDTLRYAMGRQPLTSALHLGRIAALLDMAARTGLDSAEVAAARKQLAEQLWTLRGTIEQPGQAEHLGQRFDTLRLVKGIQFWSDGAPVPYNYISAYVSGLLASWSGSSAAADRAQVLLQPLLQLELPQFAQDWHYWWSQGRLGWSAEDAVSVNTPVYGGSPNIAHVSYRTMDADALLRLHALRPGALPDDLEQNLRRLVAAGQLLPSLNEQLVRTGAAQPLSPAVLRRFARATGPWELQSQFWALEQLAAGL